MLKQRLHTYFYVQLMTATRRTRADDDVGKETEGLIYSALNDVRFWRNETLLNRRRQRHSRYLVLVRKTEKQSSGRNTE